MTKCKTCDKVPITASYTVIRQRGFADKSDHYTIDRKNWGLVEDDDGNVRTFSSFEDAQEYVDRLYDDEGYKLAVKK